jgi:hypothetical protein
MRKIIALCSVLCSTSALAVDADFSKSFVVPESSGVNTITIGGIEAVGDSYSVDFKLREDLTLFITDASIQNSISEILEQKLRNTTWQGTYTISDNSYTTNLNLVVVQNGYVGGEITHSQINGDKRGFLNARLTGDIITQFEINGSFVDEDRVNTEDFNQLTEDTPNRQLIRIKRMRAFDFVTSSGSSGWSTNREYRLILDNGALSGSVGIPNEIYGTSDGTSENGTINLVQQ